MVEKREYHGFRLKQRKDPKAVSFFVFAALPEDIIKWSWVNRQIERPQGIQRLISPARKRAIQKFFKSDPLNATPTSVVLAFKPNSTIFKPVPENIKKTGITPEYLPKGSFEWGTLSFEFDPELPEIERPAFVVDGQHRLYGMSEFKEAELPILVSVLIDANPNEMAFQFIVINNKVRKVPSDLVRSLIVDFNENDLQERLKTARVSLQPHAILLGIVDDELESPFYQMVKWDRRRGVGNPVIKPKAIEDSLKFIRYRFPDFDDDDEALIDFFFAMWQGVKDEYPQLWESTDNHLLENAGFKALSEYLADAIDTISGVDVGFDIDIFDQKSITETTKRFISQIDAQFWQAEWKLKSLDTSSGRKTIKEDIIQIRRNFKNGTEWSYGLTLV